MNLFGMFLFEVIVAALFSLAFIGGIQKIKSLCYLALAK